MAHSGETLLQVKHALLPLLQAWCCFVGGILVLKEVLLSSCSFTLVGFVLLAFAFWKFTLSKPSPASVSRFFGSAEQENELKVVAHRGAGLDAPENSLSAVRLAHSKGCTAIEFDVEITGDGVPIIFHDDTIDRMTDSTGYVSKMTWAQIQELDISVKHPMREKYKGERIPTFDAMVKLCLELKLKMFIDVKTYNPKIVAAILDLMEKNPELVESAIVSSFWPHVLYQIRKAYPSIMCSMAWRPGFLSYEDYNSHDGPIRPRSHSIPHHYTTLVLDLLFKWCYRNIFVSFIGLSAIVLQKDSVSAEDVRVWRKSKDLRIVAWTSNLPNEQKFLTDVLKVPYMTDTIPSVAL